MRTAGLVLLVALVFTGCHANKTFVQTFEREDDPNQTLVLTSPTGLIHPNAGFPHNLFFKVFGGGEVEGTYEQKTAKDTVKGLSLIHISEPTRLLSISYAVFC